MAKGATSGGQSIPANSKTSSGTTTSTPSPEAQALIAQALPGVTSLQNFKLPDYSAIAPFDPLQVQGQDAAVKAALGSQSQIADQTARQLQFLSGDVLYPSSNPALSQTISNATQRSTDQLLNAALPAVRNSAVQAGQFGGSRQGIAEGQAIKGAAQAAGDTAANIASAGYGQGLNAFTQGLQLSPGISQLQLAPALTLSGVGDVKQQLQQALLGQQYNTDITNQLLPFLSSQQLLAAASGLPGGTVSTQGTSNADIKKAVLPHSNPVSSALGGAAQGAALGSMLFPGVGTAVGAGAGALLPFLLG